MREHLFQTGLAAMMIAGGLGSTVSAATIVEHFDYTAGLNIIGQSGGTGWAAGSSWTEESSNSDGTALAASPGLTYPGVSAAGNKATITAGTSSLYITRDTGTTFGTEGTTTYISFIAQRLAPALPAYSKFFGVTLQNGTDELLLIGQGSGDTVWEIVGNGAADGSNGTASSTVSSTTQALLVVRLDAVAGNDTVTLWVNPDLSLTESQNTFNAQMNSVNIGTFDNIQFGGSRTALAGANFDLDELTISNDTPFAVPEPASLALLGLGAGALVLRRRHRALSHSQ